jgi:hypothetical protein
MRHILYAITLALVTNIFAPHLAQAESWKPLCVGGGNTAGIHNNTWQKLNTTANGGGTWKQVGNCTAPPPPPPSLYYGSSSVSGICSSNGCQKNYGGIVNNDVLVAAGAVAANNADLASVIQFLYNSCPLGSGWNYVIHTITIGPVTGTCITDHEIFSYNGKSARNTSWDLTYNGIPK